MGCGDGATPGRRREGRADREGDGRRLSRRRPAPARRLRRDHGVVRGAAVRCCGPRVGHGSPPAGRGRPLGPGTARRPHPQALADADEGRRDQSAARAVHALPTPARTGPAARTATTARRSGAAARSPAGSGRARPAPRRPTGTWLSETGPSARRCATPGPAPARPRAGRRTPAGWRSGARSRRASDRPTSRSSRRRRRSPGRCSTRPAASPRRRAGTRAAPGPDRPAPRGTRRRRRAPQRRTRASTGPGRTG